MKNLLKSHAYQLKTMDLFSIFFQLKWSLFYSIIAICLGNATAALDSFIVTSSQCVYVTSNSCARYAGVYSNIENNLNAYDNLLKTQFPNRFGDQTQLEADVTIAFYRDYFAKTCSQHLQRFICYNVFPPCVQESAESRAVPLCRSMCEDIVTSCGDVVRGDGDENRDVYSLFDCSQYPEESVLTNQNGDMSCFNVASLEIFSWNYTNISGTDNNFPSNVN